MRSRPNPFHHLLAMALLMSAAALLATPASDAAGPGRGGGGHHAASAPRASRSPAPRSAPSTVQRDARGRIVRSEAAKEQFMRQTGYPHGRPGYVVDHIVPLAKGGADDPSNMQWQTVEEAKAKDKWERK